MTEAKNSKKVRRKIIQIDEDLCTGCGKCVISCAEGALVIIDGKAKVISEVFCDGLGACIGECPEGALTIVEREAYDFDEDAVEEHLEVLKKQEKAEETNALQKHINLGNPNHKCSCPSANTIVYDKAWKEVNLSEEIPSALRQWPTKLTLVSPTAPYFNNEEIVIVSDCSPVAYGDFHRKILKGRPIVTVCPMLGLGEVELQKLEEILRLNPIQKIEVILMEVPCCQKFRIFLEPILAKINRSIIIEETIISRDGKIIEKIINK